MKSKKRTLLFGAFVCCVSSFLCMKSVNAKIISVPEEQAGIQAAIDIATSGDTVAIASGVYEERLVLKSGVRLQGAGADHCLIQAAAGIRPVLLVQDCQELAISGLHFQSTHKAVFFGDDSLVGPVVLLENSQVDMTSCRVSKGPRSGIKIRGASQVQIRDCHIEGHGWAGVAVYGADAAPTLTDNTVTHNKRYGIVLGAGVQAMVTGNTCTHNADYGVFASGKMTIATLSKNRCLHNGSGISFQDHARGVVEYNECRENRLHGIHAQGRRTRPELRKNQCAENGMNGIVLGRESAPLVEENRCERNHYNGIKIETNRPGATIRANHCVDNLNAGLHFLGGWKCVVGANHSVGNQALSEGELLYLVGKQDFETLEAIAQGARRDHPVSVGGRWMLRTFYTELARFAYPYGRFRRSIEAIELFLDAWLMAKPDSATPHLVRASLYEQIAKAVEKNADLSSYDFTPPTNAAACYEKSLAALRTAQALAPQDPELYTQLVRIGSALKWEEGLDRATKTAAIRSTAPEAWTRLETLFRQGLRVFPDYAPLYRARLQSLLDTEQADQLLPAFAAAQVRRTQAQRGETLYTLVYTEFIKNRLARGGDLRGWKNIAVDSARLAQGFEDWAKHVADPNRVYAAQALWFCLRGEKEAASGLFSSLPTASFQEWPWRGITYRAYKQWVQGAVSPIVWDWRLQQCAEEQRFEDAKRLLEAGFDPNIITPLGFMTLNWLCSWQRAEWVELFLAHGADPNGSSAYGSSALICTISNDNTVLSKLLLDQGADVDLESGQGLWPLAHAIKTNKLLAAAYLIDYGARLDKRTVEGYTPLALAVEKKNKAIINMLLERGADPNTLDGNGLSPLWKAVAGGEVAVLRLLIDKGADPAFVWRGEKSLLEFAREQENASDLLPVLESAATITAE